VFASFRWSMLKRKTRS